jgi:serine/threonine protein kinase
MKVQAEFVRIPQPRDDIEDFPLIPAKTPLLAGLKVLNKIHESRFPVFLVYSSHHQCNLALKIFPFKDEEPQISYKTEAQFRVLNHPHIVKMVHCAEKQRSSIGAQKFNASCILMELASHGDFADLLVKYNFYTDEILARTFFHHLIEGVEYLHKRNIGHMDLKLENLLLGDDLKLKIADFDLSCEANNQTKYNKGRGTCNYRAPEIKTKNCYDPKAADLYSVGIILFTLVTGGFPGVEDSIVEGYNLFEMMIAGNEMFWAAHAQIHKGGISFDAEFKKLFMGMVTADTEMRFTVENVKKSKWYQGRIYTEDELAARLSEFGVGCKHAKGS